MTSLREELERVKAQQAEIRMLALQELDDIRDHLDEAERELEETKRRIEQRIESELEKAKEAVQYLALGSVGDDDGRKWILNELYWYYPYLSAKILAETFGVRGPSRVSVWAGPLRDSPFQCKRCGNAVEVRSRAHMKELMQKKAQGVICEDCESIDRAQRSAEYEARWRAEERTRQIRLHELRTMPYRDYLQTPEWEEKRAKALRRANYSCQLCNAEKVELHVHHRTYERRGEEYASDLIVLCYSCHGRFHGKENQP